MKSFALLFSVLILFAGCKSGSDVAGSATEKTQICIYSGNSAGIIAAYSAKRMGKEVIVISPEKHIGGLTAGGLGSTDIGNKFAITGLSRRFYRQIGAHYGEFEGWAFEPHVAENLYLDYVKEQKIDVRYQWRLKSVNKKGSVIKSIVIENALNPSEVKTIEADMFMDCSYEGDLMGNAGVSFHVGRESNDTYGETINGVQLLNQHQFEDGIDPYVIEGDSTSGLLPGINPAPVQPNGTGDKKIQAYNYRLCLTQDTNNFIPLQKPEGYDAKNYALLGRLVTTRERKGWKNHGVRANYLIINDMPNGKTDVNHKGGFSIDYIGMNHNYIDASYEERAEMWRAHENYIKGMLYFLATDSSVPEHMRAEMNSWGWAKDEFTDNGGFPHQMYVREGRRMIGEYVMTEHNCVGDSVVEDGIGLAAYTMDSHNCDRHVVNGMVKNEGNVEVGGFPPYPIAYRSLTPKREECTNLIVPVAMSASHIAYGSIRMEPVFMALAQASAIAAGMAIDNNTSIQTIDVNALQEKLKNDPHLDGSTPEILVDNDTDADKITLTGNWENITTGRSKYKNGFLLSANGVKGISYRLPKKVGEIDHSAGIVPGKEPAAQAPDTVVLPAGTPATALFKPEIKTSGKYRVYFFCAQNSKKLDTTAAYADTVAFEVTHKNGTTGVKSATQPYLNRWADLGEYEFEAGKAAGVLLDGKNSSGAIIADAVLLVPVGH